MDSAFPWALMMGTPSGKGALAFSKFSYGCTGLLGGISVSGVAMPVCKQLCQAKSVQDSLVRFFPTWHFLLQAGVTASEDTSIKGSIDAFFCMIKNCRGVHSSTLCCRGTCLLNCLACNACVKSASSTKHATQRENQTNPVAAKLQCIHYIEPCSIPWQCLEFHPKATHPLLLHIPHGAQC